MTWVLREAAKTQLSHKFGRVHRLRPDLFRSGHQGTRGGRTRGGSVGSAASRGVCFSAARVCAGRTEQASSESTGTQGGRLCCH